MGHLCYDQSRGNHKGCEANKQIPQRSRNPHRNATTGDYRRSGYDRGHLAPAADMAFSRQTMADSFFMSNMSPQKPAFNREIWKDLEALVRSFAITEQKIVVVTGPILPKKKQFLSGQIR